MEIGPVTLFRVTRDADVELDEEEDDAPLPELVQEQIRQRRYEPVVRLEFALGADPAIKEMLRQRFDLDAVDLYDAPAELDYNSLFEIAGLNIPELRYQSWSPDSSAGVCQRRS